MLNFLEWNNEIFLINTILYKDRLINCDSTCSYCKFSKEKMKYFREIVFELNKNAIEANIKID